jgi:heptosyltransferase-3
VRSAHEGLRIRDFSSTDWLALFADDAPLGAAAKAALARTQTAIVYLAGDTSIAEKVLRENGVSRVVCAEPPRAGIASSPPQHASRRLLEPLAALPDVAAHFENALDLKSVAADPFLEIDEAETVNALAKLGCDAPPDGGFFALHPGSGGRKKCWPAKNFAKLLARISARGQTPLVFFGPADDEIREEFETSIAPGIDWECAAGRPLREVLALLSCCRGYVGNDSGLTHLAARACPTLAIFGPTDPVVWSPLGDNVEIVSAPGNDLTRLSVDEIVDRLSTL